MSNMEIKKRKKIIYILTSLYFSFLLIGVMSLIMTINEGNLVMLSLIPLSLGLFIMYFTELLKISLERRE